MQLTQKVDSTMNRSSSSPFGNPSFSSMVSNSSSPAPVSSTPSVFGTPPSTTHGLWSASPAAHTSSLFGSSSPPASASPQSTPPLKFGGGFSAAPSSGGFGAPSTGASPNPTTYGAVAAASPIPFQFALAKKGPGWGSPVNTADFDGVTISAEKAAILGNIKRKHPSCLSSLRLRSESHRRSAYEHLVQVIEELKAAIGGKGGCDSYDKVLVWLDDLEIYGFDMGWLREEVVKLRDRTMEEMAEKEAKRKARDELVKQIEAIDADLAAKDNAAAAAAAAPPEFVSDLFRA